MWRFATFFIGVKMNHNEFLNKICSMDKNIEILSEYINGDTFLSCRCKTCSHVWESKGKNLLRGRTRCPECAKAAGKSRATLNDSDFVTRSSKSSPGIKIIGKYSGMNTPIECQCKSCGCKTYFKPSNLLYKGTSCPECRKKTKHRNIKKTHQEFLDDLLMVTDKIEILSEYVNAKTHVRCRCNVCGHEWTSKPSNLLSGFGCKKCSNKANAGRQLKSRKKFIDELKEILPDIKVIGEYTGNRSPIECECMKCNTRWSPMPFNLLKGEGCPYCNESHGERKIRMYLDSNSIKYIYQKRFDNLFGIGGGKLSYDFFLPQYNLFIEYQGVQHEKPNRKFGGVIQFNNQIEHDKRKREYAKENGYDLLEIWYYDEANIDNILTKHLSIIFPVTITA